jgi:hypothetical protein
VQEKNESQQLLFCQCFRLPDTPVPDIYQFRI